MSTLRYRSPGLSALAYKNKSKGLASRTVNQRGTLRVYLDLTEAAPDSLNQQSTSDMNESGMASNKKPRLDNDEDQAEDTYKEPLDEQFLIDENNKMAELYGEGAVFVTSFDKQPHRVRYCCQVCTIDTNSENNLHAHFAGKNHAKNQMMAEKEMTWEEKTGPNMDERRMSQYGGRTKEHSDFYSHDVPSNRDRFYRNPDPYSRGGPGDHISRPRTMGEQYPVDDGYVPARYSPQRPNTSHRPAAPPPLPPSAASIIDLARRNLPPPKQERLSRGKTGILLQELANCNVKDMCDAEVAADVVISLTKSLKDYMKIRKLTTASIQMRLILDETAVKINLIKSLLKENSTPRLRSALPLPAMRGPTQPLKRPYEPEAYQGPPNPSKAYRPPDHSFYILDDRMQRAKF